MNHLFSLGFSPLISVPVQGGTRCSVSKRPCSYRMVLWDLLPIDSALYTEIVETGWYTKPANKGLMLNEKSHHPEHMKQASISNTINTYTTICSTDALLKEAEQTFKRRAIRNGYDSGYVDRVKQRKKTTQKPKESLPTLTIPYVSSAFTTSKEPSNVQTWKCEYFNDPKAA